MIKMKCNLWLCIVLLLTCCSPTYGNAKDETETGDENTWCWKEYTAAAVLGGTAAVAAAPFALGAAGFTAGGVAAGSIAASIQSAVYGGAVASSSVFAVLQSIGAAGLGAGAKVGLFSVGAGAATYLKNKIAPCVEGPECKPDKK